ncbi:MAG TPA: trypsin-like peptidase domain-containing protein [Blastocatellia bacterium]|nr:trypsin-like peptidase domain-containing protein [Blastocatellia bacterium]
MQATFTRVIGSHRGEQRKFNAARISVGRASDNMLCLGESARRVSSHHAEILRRGDGYLLRDLGSTNGTMINGRRVVVSELAHDDLIEFGTGGLLLRFGVEHDELGDSDTVPSVAGVPANPVRDRVLGLKSNAMLIAALVAAMLLGGVGGIVASSRLRAVSPETMSFAEIAELNSPAVVFIRTEFELLDSSGQVITSEARTGSGFLVSESGLIITNRHVVRDWEYNAGSPGTTGRITRIEVVLPHHSHDDVLLAGVYKLSPNSAVDVAVLKVSSSTLPSIRGIETDTNQTNQGDEVVVIGYPLGLDLLAKTRDSRIDPSLSTGVVSRVGEDFIQLNLRAYHGNSGGPVLNLRGEVIGILTANVNGVPDIALCTPISAAVHLVKDDLSLFN